MATVTATDMQTSAIWATKRGTSAGGGRRVPEGEDVPEEAEGPGDPDGPDVRDLRAAGAGVPGVDDLPEGEGGVGAVTRKLWCGKLVSR